MNWLTNFVRPKLRELVRGQKDIPDDLWHKCPDCEEMIFHRDLEKNLSVCQHCGHHMRISAAKRLQMLFDDGAYETVDTDSALTDPLKFRDQKKYTDRLKEARSKTDAPDALTVAHGKLGGIEVVIASLDFAFMGGSMGIAVGNGMLAAARLAVSKKAPLIVVSSSGGARMQEGALSLMQL
ncbi:MAG: acetyl-CoA carboxylase carboxyl transferase subunit beta, partial [Proteobacteria bacterium]|nr:acetyl-CoA carboxylase carboxyl transferase subunit beta [Pseudomonadota bacterium]